MQHGPSCSKNTILDAPGPADQATVTQRPDTAPNLLHLDAALLGNARTATPAALTPMTRLLSTVVQLRYPELAHWPELTVSDQWAHYCRANLIRTTSVLFGRDEHFVTFLAEQQHETRDQASRSAPWRTVPDVHELTPETRAAWDAVSHRLAQELGLAPSHAWEHALLRLLTVRTDLADDDGWEDVTSRYVALSTQMRGQGTLTGRQAWVLNPDRSRPNPVAPDDQAEHTPDREWRDDLTPNERQMIRLEAALLRASFPDLHWPVQRS